MLEVTVKGLAISKYGSITKFAKALCWSERKTRYIVNERQKATAQEMEQMAVALGIKTATDFMIIFLPSVSTMWTDKTDKPPDN